MRARPVVLPVCVIAVLLLVATLVHLDKFDLDTLFGWFWLIAYIARCRPLLAVRAVAPAARAPACAGAAAHAAPAGAARRAAGRRRS